MTKNTTPPKNKDMKEEKKPILEEKDEPCYKEDSLYQKQNKLSCANLDAITLFYKQIPKDARKQFLKAISDKDFMQKIAASLESYKTQGKDGDKSNPDDLAAYEAFLATQSNTTEEDYQIFKSMYITPAKCFSHVDITGDIPETGFEMSTVPCLGDQETAKIVLKKNDHGEKATACQKTCEKVVKAIKPKISTCKIPCIFTSINKDCYDVASNALSPQTIINAIRRYAVQYDMVSIIQTPQVPHGVSFFHSPPAVAVMMSSITSWLDAINDYNKLEDHQYAKWQEFILHKGPTVEVESNEWLEETLHLLMESNHSAEVESNMKGLLPN
jgi:hypothetical protein